MSQSTFANLAHVTFPANVALAVLDGLLAIPLIVKLFYIDCRRFAHYMVTSVCLSRSLF